MILDPRGTLRARFERSSSDDIFRRLGIGARRCDLGDEGLYLAEEIVAADRWLGGSDLEVLGILVLALMIAQRQGSTRLRLDPKSLRTLVGDILRIAGHEADVGKTVKQIVAITKEPGFGSVIGLAGDRRPLIVDDGCLYTDRSRHLEQRVAEKLAARMQIAQHVEIGDTPHLSAEQRAAVAMAAGGLLTVVTGGPGTGKTLVAAAIVRAFTRLGVGPIALAAQTGKAANRLTEVMVQQLGADPPPPAAQTLHRLLGYRGDGFAHHAQSPLPVGAVIVDEASMIDLELMDALLDAMPQAAPLVLIGDAHQLPAIDAGQILADLVEARARIATLAHSYRMDASDPRGRAVLAAAEAIHAGEPHRLTERNGLATPRTPGTLQWAGCEWLESSEPDSVRALATALWHHFDGPRAQQLANDTVFRFVDGRIAPAQAASLESLWQLLGRARLLAVTRGLPTGSQALNTVVHQLALDRMTASLKPEFVPGEPVMITANDYQRGLFNGDQGIIVRAEDGGGSHRYRAVFRVGGQLVPFAIEALRDRLELAWALTVHKAQGSEVDAVAVVLPDDEHHPLLTRELLYTGLTRARTSAVVCGSKAAIAAAGKRRALRESGLADRLRATLRS
jgi:exodeoxyribonuclease V alpha subunit